MNGREENENKVNKRIDVILSAYPIYLTYFRNWLMTNSHNTKYNYITQVINYLKYLHSNGIDIQDINAVSNIKPSIISSYLNYLKNKIMKTTNDVKEHISDDGLANRFYAIKKFYSFLVSDSYIMSNPCDRISPPKIKTTNEIIKLDKHEVNDILLKNIQTGVGSSRAVSSQKKWKSRDYALIVLALATGLRVTSVSEINLSDIDFNNNSIIVVEKGDRTRRITFSDNVKKALEMWIDDRKIMLESHKFYTDALFISQKKGRLCAASIENVVKKYAASIDKKITPHKLRATCATNIYNNTGDIYLTADILGHSNIQNTRRYTKISDQRKSLAISAMDDMIFHN